MTKIKLLATSFIIFAALMVSTPAFAVTNIPGLDQKVVSDNGSIVDMIIKLLGTVPNPAPGPAGVGAIIGTSGGAPVLGVSTSHAGVCDSITQTFGVCAGNWHQHYAILDGVDAGGVCSSLTGTIGVDMFRVQQLSFQSPGSNTINAQHISVNNIAKNTGILDDAIDGAFNGAPGSSPFNFSPDDLSIQPAYPVVAFDIAVFGGLDGNLVPNVVGPPPIPNGERQVCVYNVELMVVEPLVAGSISPLETTSLLIAGTFANAFWILPMLGGITGVGIYLARSKLQK